MSTYIRTVVSIPGGHALRTLQCCASEPLQRGCSVWGGSPPLWHHWILLQELIRSPSSSPPHSDHPCTDNCINAYYIYIYYTILQSDTNSYTLVPYMALIQCLAAIVFYKDAIKLWAFHLGIFDKAI